MKRNVLHVIIDAWRAAAQKLEAAPKLREVERYGEQALKLARQKALDEFRDTATVLISDWREKELPRIASERNEQRCAAMKFIQTGFPRKQFQKPEPAGYMSETEKALLARVDAIQEQNEGILQELLTAGQVSTRLALMQLTPTESIEARLAEYQSDVSNAGSEFFDFKNWAIDRIVVGPILAQRAAAGDDRAGIIQQRDLVTQVDETLMTRLSAAGPDETPGDLPESVDFLDQSLELIDFEKRGVTGAEDFSRRVDFVSRGLSEFEKFAEANPPKKLRQKEPTAPAIRPAVVSVPVTANK